jgi:bifunctional UDP-N-acetylglucosamine pyrophosphorylase/glucosamine-1-phosphate N-acetyltransferase
VSVSSSTQSASRPTPLAAIILAAGKGKRMHSDLPKVAHAVAGEPMVRWVVQACREVGASPIVLVVGHGAEVVRDVFKGERDIIFVTQEQQLGTGHAVDQARSVFADRADLDRLDVLVLAGDGPLIRPATLRQMLEAHRRSNAAATLATSVIADPTGYGRIVRDASARFLRIVEHKDASESERSIREVNPSYYCFRAGPLFRTLKRIDNKNANGEYYITDVFSLLLGDGERVEVIDAVPPEDVLSINDPQQLADVDAILRRRLTGSPLPSGGAGEGLGVRAVPNVTGDRAHLHASPLPKGQGVAPSPQPSPKGRGSAPPKVEAHR